MALQAFYWAVKQFDGAFERLDAFRTLWLLTVSLIGYVKHVNTSKADDSSLRGSTVSVLFYGCLELYKR